MKVFAQRCCSSAIGLLAFGFLVIGITGIRNAASADAACSWEIFQTVPGIEQKRSIMRDCAPDQQVELYVKWSYATMPTNDDLVDALAEQGSRAIPAIMSRIERSSRPLDQLEASQLIWALVRMQYWGYYDVRGNSELMMRLEKAVAAIPEPEFRKWEEDKLQWIRKGREQSREPR